MTNATIYCRFSDRKDSEYCQSNETQRAQCRTYCEQHGYDVAGIYLDDAISGAEEDRPILWTAIDSLKRGMVLVAYRNDRLARSVYLHELIYRAVRKKKATIEVVAGGCNGESAEDDLLRSILAAFASYERKVIAARTKASMLRRQANGYAVSKDAPYGRMEGPIQLIGGEPKRTWIDCPEEQAVIQRVRELHARGLGLREIARALNVEGTPCRGAAWSHPTISRILGRSDSAGANGSKSVAQDAP